MVTRKRILEDQLKWIKNPICLKEDLENSCMIPVMGCLEEAGMLMFWCPYCERIHFHGQGESHRCLHCLKENSPFSRSGYILKKLGDFEIPKWVKTHG